jgi:hypothetical protein
MIFEGININISNIFYLSLIYCIKLLFDKGSKFFVLKDKNSLSIAKNLFEECLSIKNSIFKDEKYLNLLSNDLKEDYNDIIEKCEKNINIISIF